MCIYLRIGLARRRRRRRVCAETRARHAATLVARRRHLNAAAVTKKGFPPLLRAINIFPYLSVAMENNLATSPPPRAAAAAAAISRRIRPTPRLSALQLLSRQPAQFPCTAVCLNDSICTLTSATTVNKGV